MYIVFQLDNAEATRMFYNEHALKDARRYAESLAEKDNGNGGFVYVCKPIDAISKTKVSYEHIWEKL